MRRPRRRRRWSTATSATAACTRASTSRSRREPARFRAFVTDAAQLVGRHGGSMSGEHGDGRARGELLPYMYSRDAIAAFGEVKALFDPDNLLNPGVIVDPAPVDADLRVPQAKSLRRGLAFAYPHDGGDLSTAVHRCVGVGKCRADTTAAGGVMCPSYLATRDEKDSTRGRARVLQELANGSLVEGLPRRGAARVARPVPVLQGLLGRLPGRRRHGHLQVRGAVPALPPPAAPAGALRAGLAAALGAAGEGARPGWPTRCCTSGAWRGAAKRAGGIDARRPLPRFAAHDVPAVVREAGRAAAVRRCMLWVDTFTDHFAPEVGQAAVRVLEAAGYSVQIPEQAGVLRADLDLHRPARRRPAAAAPHLAALDRAHPVRHARSSGWSRPAPRCCARDAGRTAARRPARGPGRGRRPGRWPSCCAQTQGWSPPNLDGVQAVAQPHCHQHAVLGWEADAQLLAGAGAEVDAVGGCCGLAGNFGVERGHYEVSRAVAETALLPAVRAAAARRGASSPTGSPAAPSSSTSPTPRAAPGPTARRHLPDEQLGRFFADRPNVRSAVTGFVPPPYPYDRLDEVTAVAAEHEGGAVDLSIGTPCDPPPPAVLAALARGRQRPRLPAVDRHAGLPRGRGRAGSRAASALPSTRLPRSRPASAPRSSSRRCRSTSNCATRRATPCSTRRSATRPTRWARRWPAAARCPYLTLDEIDASRRRAGAVRVGELAEQPHRRTARPRPRRRPGGASAASRCFSDECYAEFTWAGPADDDPAQRHRAGCSRVHSLSKRDNFAGARIGFYAGDARTGPLPARGAQARRPDAAGPGAGRGGRRARRRGARRGPARALPRPAAAPRRASSTASATRRSCPTARSTCGCRRRAATRGRRPATWPSGPASSSRRASSTDPRGAAYFRVAAVQPDERIELAARAGSDAYTP